MGLAGYVINAVLVEGRSVAEVAADHGISRSWLYERLAPLPRRQRGRPQAPVPSSSLLSWAGVGGDGGGDCGPAQVLAEEGLDAGASTIHYHLSCRHDGACGLLIRSAGSGLQLRERRSSPN